MFQSKYYTATSTAYSALELAAVQLSQGCLAQTGLIDDAPDRTKQTINQTKE